MNYLQRTLLRIKSHLDDAELDEEKKSIPLKLIVTFVSKKQFKDYLQNIIAAL
jgi:hypothetical protein